MAVTPAGTVSVEGRARESVRVRAVESDPVVVFATMSVRVALKTLAVAVGGTACVDDRVGTNVSVLVR